MDFFPQRPPVSPKIYAYELIGVASHRGYIKVGYTERDVDTRIREQTHTVAVPYRVLETWPAMRSDGSCFTDKDLHAVLRRTGDDGNRPRLHAGSYPAGAAADRRRADPGGRGCHGGTDRGRAARRPDR